MTLTKIISGGQTGADIAAVDAAIASRFAYGGELPKGRRCEKGTVPTHYLDFTVSKAYDYRVRTEKNVLSSDGTLVFTQGPPTTGTLATINLAKKYKKPCMVIDIDEPVGMVPPVSLIQQFVESHKIQVLNVAGPRESKNPGMYESVFNVMLATILHLQTVTS